MSNRASLINNVIAGLQKQIEDGKKLSTDLELQLSEQVAARKVSEEEAAELMKENAKLRRAIDKVLSISCANRVDMQATFDREMNA
jgi:hypothetical protein